MRPGDADVLLAGVEPGDRRAEVGQRLAEDAAAAADVENLAPLQRLRRWLPLFESCCT